MANEKTNIKYFIKKALVFLSVIRGYNILIIAIAQYLTSIYILSYNIHYLNVILNPILFLLVLSSSLIIAAGYIINDFYDIEKDRVNKPTKSDIDSFVSKKTKLTVYMLFNIVAYISSLFVSYRAMFFMMSYSLLIFIYSHKLKKTTFVGNILAAILAIIPFFAIFLYYKNISILILLNATYLFVLILIRELVKDMYNCNGDLIYGYKTIPVRYNMTISKYIITILVIISIAISLLLSQYQEIGKMSIYFYFSTCVLVLFVISIWYIKEINYYLLQYNMMKLLILVGVFSIVLISY